MRILIATPLYPPEPGGPATYTHLLEEGLEKNGLERPLIVKFGDVRKYPKIFRHFAYAMKLLKVGKHADALLALDPVSVGFPTLLAARFLRKSYVVKIVGDYAWEQGTQRFGIKDSLDDFVLRKDVPLPVRLLRWVQMRVALRAARIIVPSYYLKKIVCAWGVPEEKIEVIYNAIDLELGGVISDAVTKLVRPKVVTVGRLVPWKHMDGVIDAVAEVPGVTLIIAGDGPLRSSLESHAREKLSDRILFTGALPHSDTLAVMEDADIFVLNSSYEGLSHVLIEAILLGKPIITTSAGGNPELIRNEENGLVIPPYDTPALQAALIRLINDSALAARLSVHAKSESSKFGTDAMLAHTAQVLKAL